IQDASGMGLSLSIAGGKLIAARERIWLWLRHLDRSTFVYFEPDQTRKTLKLRRPFDAVKLDEHPMKLTREGYDACATHDGKLLIFDRREGTIWQVDSNTGAAEPFYSQGKLPMIDAEPAFDR